MNHLNHMNQNVVSAMLDDKILADYIIFLESEKETRHKTKFRFSDISECDSWAKFRFTKDDIPRLQSALNISETVQFSNRIVESGENALLLVLRRLSYPNRLVDLIDLFPRSEGELSVIFNETIDHIYGAFRYLLEDVSNLVWLSPENLLEYSAAVSRKGSPLLGFYRRHSSPDVQTRFGTGSYIQWS